MAANPLTLIRSRWSPLLWVLLSTSALCAPARAEDPAATDPGIKLRGAFPAAAEDPAAKQEPRNELLLPNTTVIQRTPDATAGPTAGQTQVNLVALLTADGQRI